MNEEYIDTVKHLIEQKDADKVKELLIDLHPADIAELCNDLNAEGARFIYRLLDNETAADVLVEMDEDARKELLEMLPSETIAKRFVDYMDTDDAVDLMRELDEDKHRSAPLAVLPSNIIANSSKVGRFFHEPTRPQVIQCTAGCRLPTPAD